MCPRSSDPFYIVTLLYTMGMDTQYAHAIQYVSKSKLKFINMVEKVIQ